MVVLGLILILLGVVLGGYTVLAGLPAQTGTDVELSFLGLTVQTSAVVVFALGALTLLLIELGVLAMRSGARKAARRRAELQRLRRVEAEVQTRQSAEVQRNATATQSAPAPAPFARRDHGDGDTGRNETVRSDVRPDGVRPDSTGTGAQERIADTRNDLSETRAPEHDTRGTGTGATVERDATDGSRTDRS